MDTKFQTSFIPKKPILAEQNMTKRGSRTSILMFVAVILFVVSITSAVMMVVWKGILLKNQANYAIELKKAEERFGTETIDRLKKVNTKIDLSKKLLSNHMSASEIFSIIAALTIDGIRFKSFDFSAPAKDGENIKLSLKGSGSNFSAIAFQSDVFGQSSKFGKNKVLKNPIISDLTLDDTGNVSFTFNTEIDTKDLLYEKVLIGEITQ